MGEAETGAFGGAAQGAAAGAMVGGPWGAAVGGGLGLVTGAVGGKKSKKGRRRAAAAAQAAAMAQQRAAQEAFQRTEAPTTAALLNFDTAIKSQERNLARQEQLVAQIDPTIIEASQQALKLLKGEQSSSLAPARAQRDFQRQKLVNTLRAQLGPGAETSTAGMQALSRFDSETNSLLAGQQQSALQGLGQTFGTFSSYKPNMLAEAQGLGSLAQGRAGVAFDRERIVAPGLQQTAGAQYTGALLRGQSEMAQGQQIAGIGGQLLGMAAMSGLMGKSGGGITSDAPLGAADKSFLFG